MDQQRVCGRKRISDLFKAQGMCLMAANVILPAGGANGDPPNLSWILWATSRRGKEEEKEGKGRK